MSANDEMQGASKWTTAWKVTAVISGLTLLTAALMLTDLVSPKPVADEQYEVYSSYLRDGLSQNAHDFGNGTGTILIADHSMIAYDLGKPEQWRFAVASAMNLHRRPDPPRLLLILDLTLANLRSHRFDRRLELPNEYHLLDSAALADPKLHERFPRSLGFLTFSSVAFNLNLTEALFYTEHICGLCGGGEYVVMKKVQGNWVVVNRYWTWVS